MMFGVVLLAAVAGLTTGAVDKAFHGHAGAYVQVDCATGEQFVTDAGRCAEMVAPCSTFKIWNSAIGLELGLVPGPDAPFWKWDGVTRDVAPGWNEDQTLRSAFARSCVPAYQNLARRIGAARMQQWLDRIGYGNRDISSGVDLFWLPQPGRNALLISAREQAALLARLATGSVPFSEKTLVDLKDIMRVRATEKGTLYGKTGTSGRNAGSYGWFVGYVESGGRQYAFACRLHGDTVTGRDARAAVEEILTAQGLL